MNQGLAMYSIRRVLACPLCCLRSIRALMADGMTAFQFYLPNPDPVKRWALEPRFSEKSMHIFHCLVGTG